MLEKGIQMLRAAAYLKGGETGCWTSKFCYLQVEILQGAQPFLGHEPSTCLDVTGTEYILVTQDQKDLSIKYSFRLLAMGFHSSSLSNFECKSNLFPIFVAHQLLEPATLKSWVLLNLFTLSPALMVTSPFMSRLQTSSSISRKQLSRLEIPSVQLSHAWLNYDWSSAFFCDLWFSSFFFFPLFFPTVAVNTTFLCNGALWNHPHWKKLHLQPEPKPRSETRWECRWTAPIHLSRRTASGSLKQSKTDATSVWIAGMMVNIFAFSSYSYPFGSMRKRSLWSRRRAPTWGRS